MDLMKIVAAIPSLNAEASIGDIVTRARGYVNQVIVIEDGSRDATLRIARAAGALVLSHGNIRGYGNSIKSCFEEAKKNNVDILVILDSDGQHDPEEIPLFIKPLIDGEADMVIGSRFLGVENNMPQYRKLGIGIVTWLFNVGSKVKVTDAQSGFRAYSKKVLDALSLVENGMGVSVEIPVKVRVKGFTIKEVPISCYYHRGSSTMNPVLQGLQVTFILLKLRLKDICRKMMSRAD